jgi:hypothetical protein
VAKYRRAAKIGSNQPEIVARLRQLPGISVVVGHDDILVGYGNKTFWFELKEPECVSKKTGQILDSKKKPEQVKLEQNWSGHYRIVWSLDQILREIGYATIDY